MTAASISQRYRDIPSVLKIARTEYNSLNTTDRDIPIQCEIDLHCSQDKEKKGRDKDCPIKLADQLTMCSGAVSVTVT